MSVAELPGQLIGGERVGALDGERFKVLDPSTGEHIADVPRSKAVDVDRAVQAARNAFAQWRHTSPADRGRLLTGIARRLRDQAGELAALGSLDGGLPLPAVQRDVEATARYFEYYGGLADKIGGDVVPLGEGFLDYTERQPFGVCAVILPFNSPFQIVARSAAPALAAGNTVVIKAAEQAPLGPLRLAEGCSTSSPASAARPARAWWSTPTSTGSPSPAPRPPGGSSPKPPPATSRR